MRVRFDSTSRIRRLTDDLRAAIFFNSKRVAFLSVLHPLDPCSFSATSLHWRRKISAEHPEIHVHGSTDCVKSFLQVRHRCSIPCSLNLCRCFKSRFLNFILHSSQESLSGRCLGNPTNLGWSIANQGFEKLDLQMYRCIWFTLIRAGPGLTAGRPGPFELSLP